MDISCSILSIIYIYSIGSETDVSVLVRVQCDLRKSVYELVRRDYVRLIQKSYFFNDTGRISWFIFNMNGILISKSKSFQKRKRESFPVC